MSIELPEDKVKRTLDSLSRFGKIISCNLRKFASLVGTLIFRHPALQYEMICVRLFEKARSRALEVERNTFDAMITLPKYLNEDIAWWKTNIRVTSAPISEPIFELEIFSDALRTEWEFFAVVIAAMGSGMLKV